MNSQPLTEAGANCPAETLEEARGERGPLGLPEPKLEPNDSAIIREGIEPGDWAGHGVADVKSRSMTISNGTDQQWRWHAGGSASTPVQGLDSAIVLSPIEGCSSS